MNDRHRRAWLVGDWTDDTDQMVVIMESIIYSDGQVINCLMVKLCIVLTEKIGPTFYIWHKNA